MKLMPIMFRVFANLLIAVWLMFLLNGRFGLGMSVYLIGGIVLLLLGAAGSESVKSLNESLASKAKDFLSIVVHTAISAAFVFFSIGKPVLALVALSVVLAAIYSAGDMFRVLVKRQS